MKNFILLSFLILIFTPKINSQKLFVDSYSKTTHYISRFRYEDSLFNINSLKMRDPDNKDLIFRQHVFDLDNMTSTYYCDGDSSVLEIKVDFITNTQMIIHILEDEVDYGYVINVDPNNELFYRYDTQFNKMIELNTFEYVIRKPM